MRGASKSTAVAIALSALLCSSASAVQVKAPTGAMRAEPAQAASRFIDSIGVNVHLSYRTTGYGDTARVTALLQQLGVRHLRDGVTLGRTDVCRAERALAAKGFRFTAITQTNPSALQLRTWATCVGPALEAFEGLNEYDISHPQSDAQWATTVRSSQHDLYRNVKGTPQLAAFPVVGPSLTSEAAFRAVGDLSSDLDVGNMHDYFSFHEPETNGWGLNGYGSLAFNVRLAQMVSATKPIEATETGYGTDRTDHTVDDVTQAIYLPRLFLEHFSAGIPRTFAYELLDEGDPPFAHYGIVDDHSVPKPAFIALSSLIAALRDPAKPFAPGSLRYSLDGSGDDVRHLLLQKRAGRYVLALWIAAPSCDPVTHAAQAVPTKAVTIRVDAPLRSAAVSAYGSDWRFHAVRLPVTAPLRVTVTDRVTLVDIETTTA